MQMAGHLPRYLTGLLPLLAAIVAGVDSAIVVATVNMLRRRRVDCRLEHASGRRITQVHPLPGLAGVLAAEQRAFFGCPRRSTAAAGSAGGNFGIVRW